MTAAAPAPTDVKSTLEEMRAAVAARGVRTGLAGTIEDVFLRLLTMLLGILEDLRAGRLAAVADGVRDGGRGGMAPPLPPLVRSAAQSPARGEADVRRGSGVESGEARAASGRAGADTPAGDDPSPSRCCGSGPGARPSLFLIGLCPGSARWSPAPGQVARTTSTRLAFRPDGPMRAAFAALRRRVEGLFFKNGIAGAGISVALLLQRQNDVVAIRSESIFS